MKSEELQAGHLYRLTQDVENPLCDKRSSDKFKKLPVFPKRMLMMCFAPEDTPRLRRLHSTNIGITGHNSCRGFTAVVHRSKGMGLSNRDDDRRWAEVIVPHLEEAAIDSWELMRKAYGWCAETAILRELLEDGTVSIERVLEMARRHTPNTFGQ